MQRRVRPRILRGGLTPGAESDRFRRVSLYRAWSGGSVQRDESGNVLSDELARETLFQRDFPKELALKGKVQTDGPERDDFHYCCRT